MAAFSQTIIIGNVGNVPELKRLQDDVSVCNFSVAVTERWNDNEKTTWFKVSAWRKLAEVCDQYVHKGMQVMVTGTIDCDAYLDRDGNAAASLKLTAHKVVFLGKRENEESRNDPF